MSLLCVVAGKLNKMAKYRPTPVCPYCGKPVAKAIYKDQSKIPQIFRIIGDTFLRWEPIKHSCKGNREAENK